MSGSEDGTIRIYDSTTYRLEKVLNYGMDRVWSLSVQKGGNHVALGYDEGSIVVKIGSEEPLIMIGREGWKDTTDTLWVCPSSVWIHFLF